MARGSRVWQLRKYVMMEGRWEERLQGPFRAVQTKKSVLKRMFTLYLWDNNLPQVPRYLGKRI